MYFGEQRQQSKLAAAPMFGWFIPEQLPSSGPGHYSWGDKPAFSLGANGAYADPSRTWGAQLRIVASLVADAKPLGACGKKKKTIEYNFWEPAERKLAEEIIR